LVSNDQRDKVPRLAADSRGTFGERIFVIDMRKLPSRSRATTLVRGFALVAAAALVVGCAPQLADVAEPPAAGSRAPAAATDPTERYPAVNDMPARRDTKPLTEEERQRLVDELSAARERQRVETAEPAVVGGQAEAPR